MGENGREREKETETDTDTDTDTENEANGREWERDLPTTRSQEANSIISNKACAYLSPVLRVC